MPIYKQLRINFTPEDYSKLKNQAMQQDLKLAAYCRQLINAKIPQDIKRRKRQYKIVQIDKHLLYEINAVGKNLNQIARHINIKKEIDKRTLISLKNIEITIQNILKESNYDN